MTLGGLAGEALAKSRVLGYAGGFASGAGTSLSCGEMYSRWRFGSSYPRAALCYRRLQFPLEVRGDEVSWGLQWERQLSCPPVLLACSELGGDAASL